MNMPLRKSRERGVSITEYAVMLVLVALGVVAFGSDIQNAVVNVFETLIGLLG